MTGVRWVGFGWAFMVVGVALFVAAPSAPGLHLFGGSALATSFPPAPGSSIGVTKNVTVGTDPRDVAYDPATKEVYVANYGASSISVINGSTNKVTHTISVGKGPEFLAYDPTNREMYVVNSGSNNLSAISAADKVVATIPVHGTIDGAPVYDPKNGDMYVLSEAYTLLKIYYNLTRIAHATNGGTTLHVGAAPNVAVYDNATTEIIVSNGGANTLSRVNSTTNTVSTVMLPKGTYPFQMAYSAVSKDVYVVDSGTHGTGNVSVYAPAGTISTTITVGNSPTFVLVDPSNGAVFVTNTGTANHTTGKYPAATVSVIASTNVLKATLKVGREAFLTTYDPADGYVYVPCEQSNATYAINATSFKLVGSPLTTKQFPDVAFYDPVQQAMLVFGNSNTTGTPTFTTVTIISSANTVAGSVSLPKGAVGGGCYDPKNQEGYVSNEKASSVSILK